ncbi:MAG: tetratricopeptide repeat protein [Candidatus Delongbacteria bacterium]|nr:tetratricopeptide repeat protein [Candidatus Delongbacteria bacterium]
MRKSINEKLHIVKHSTSPKKIKKLSIQHGITTKTIRSWIRQAEEGKLNPPVTKNGQVSVPVEACGRKVLKSLVFKKESIEYPFKETNRGEISRYLFTDQDTGLEFCAYSTDRSGDCLKKFIVKITEEITLARKTVRRFITDSVSGTEEIRKLLAGYGIELDIRKLNEIKKHLRFSLKKHNYIKEREKYENDGDFLFDSLATVSRNNEMIFEQRKFRNKALPECVKKINIMLHSEIFKGEQVDLNEPQFISKIQKQFDRAIEFHKVYDAANADPIYEKIYYILKKSGIADEILVKTLIQRAKLAAMKKDYTESFKIISSALRYLKSSRLPNANQIEHTVYVLSCDIYRVRKDKNKCLHYLRKAEKLLEDISDVPTSVMAFLNFGRVYSNFDDSKKTKYYYDLSKSLAHSNGLKQYYTIIEESLASLYSTTGRYDEAKKVFEKMIEEDHYSDAPFFRALLFAKTADIYHHTGDLSKSIEFYDRAIEMINKHKGLRSFTEILLISVNNKSFTLIKMNRFKEAREIIESNLETAKAENFPELVFSIIINLIICDIELKDIKTAVKNLNLLGELLKNSKKPEYEYKYLLGKGEVELMNGRHEKAYEYFERALEVTGSVLNTKTPYYDASLKFIGLMTDMKEFDKAEELAKGIRKKAMKEKFDSYIFKAELYINKIGYYKRGNKSGYLKHLNSVLTEKNHSEESVFYVSKELKTVRDSI